MAVEGNRRVRNSDPWSELECLADRLFEAEREAERTQETYGNF